MVVAGARTIQCCALSSQHGKAMPLRLRNLSARLHFYPCDRLGARCHGRRATSGHPRQ